MDIFNGKENFMFNFRTDLAAERREIYRTANKLENEIDGIESIECINNGAILNTTTNTARYSIQIKITYEKESEVI